MDSRSTLRQRLQQKRQNLSADAKIQSGIKLLQNVQTWLASSSLAQQPLHVAGYQATNGEIDPAATLAWLRDLGHCTYLPIIRDEQAGRLVFAPVTGDTKFTPGRFRIPEPIFAASDLVFAADLNLILTPLVGFDLRGNRLGMGGGFYDRTFSYKIGISGTEHHHSVQNLLGIAHEFQLIDQVPVESWDVPLDAVITDRAIYTID